MGNKKFISFFIIFTLSLISCNDSSIRKSAIVVGYDTTRILVKFSYEIRDAPATQVKGILHFHKILFDSVRFFPDELIAHQVNVHQNQPNTRDKTNRPQIRDVIELPPIGKASFLCNDTLEKSIVLYKSNMEYKIPIKFEFSSAIKIDSLLLENRKAFEFYPLRFKY